MATAGHEGNKGAPKYHWQVTAIANENTLDEIVVIFNVQGWNGEDAYGAARLKLDTTDGDWRITAVEECEDPRPA